MFTGIVEELAKVASVESNQGNLNLYIESSFTNQLKIDQSVAHNGVCLTVVDIDGPIYCVTAIEETLKKTNLGQLKKGDLVNLERAMKLGDRLDGHLVQGHVDQTGTVTNIKVQDGSWLFSFEYDAIFGNITIEKGSITVDGTSLTVINSGSHTFSVAIIPYTFENTLFKTYTIGSKVNLEFDLIGKYVKKLAAVS